MCFCCGFTQFHFYYGHSHGRIWNPPLRSANPVAFCLPPTSAGWGHPALHPTEKGERRAASPLAAVPASGHSKPSVQSPHPYPADKSLPLTREAGLSKIASLPYCVCRGAHGSPVSLPPQRNFRDSFHTRQTGTGEQCSPLQERFDTLLQP